MSEKNTPLLTARRHGDPKRRGEVREEPFGNAQGRPFGGLRGDILRRMSQALASHGESMAKVNSIDK
jgi:hypothetical protein